MVSLLYCGNTLFLWFISVKRNTSNYMVSIVSEMIKKVVLHEDNHHVQGFLYMGRSLQRIISQKV